MSLNITKENTNKLNLADLMNQELWVEHFSEPNEAFTVISSKRIGLGKSAEEWASKPLRYYIFKNKSVSKADKEAESNKDLDKLSQ